MRNRVRKQGLFKYQVRYVRWEDGIDADGDDARFVAIGVRSRNDRDDLTSLELDIIVDATVAELKRAKELVGLTYLEPEDA